MVEQIEAYQVLDYFVRRLNNVTGFDGRPEIIRERFKDGVASLDTYKTVCQRFLVCQCLRQMRFDARIDLGVWCRSDGLVLQQPLSCNVPSRKRLAAREAGRLLDRSYQFPIMIASNKPGSQRRQNVIVLEQCLTGRIVVAMPYVKPTGEGAPKIP